MNKSQYRENIECHDISEVRLGLGGEVSFRGRSPIQRVLCRCAASQKRKSIVPHHKERPYASGGWDV